MFYRQREYHPRINFNLPSTTFREAFRIDPPVVREIERRIGAYIKRQTERSVALSEREQILLTLHFLGNGSYYHINGHMHGIDKGTICRVVHRVCFLITKHILPLYVRWPSNTGHIARLFEQKAGFPDVKGIIDGTHVHIDAPSVDEPVFVGRDNRHSINVVVVSGPHHEFYFISAKSPGSFHDSRALQTSALWNAWELQQWRPDNDERSIILGDSAYPLKSWLMTPNIRGINANNPNLERGKNSFLRKHRKTRFMVECAIGIWKEQFPVLNHMRVKSPRRISTIIYACATLHNMENHFRHGSYAFDQILNQIANGREVINDRNDEDRDDGMNNRFDEAAATARQRELIEYFAVAR